MKNPAAVAGPPGPRPVVAYAPAKLNLFLEILGKRADGYHDLETLILAVDWYDTIELVPDGEPTIRLTCNDAMLPTDGRNLVYRAAEGMKPDGGLELRLTKRIPHEAGLGGGSSDAAATLIAMNRAFPLGRSQDELTAMAARLGSDVPFFLSGSAAWCTGRGDVVEPVPVGGTFHFVAIKPPVGCPTAEVYKRTVLPSIRRNGQEALDALERGDPEKLAAGMFNRLQDATFLLAPEVRDRYDRLIRSNPLGVQVTGSGSTVFAVCRDRAEAIRIADECRTPDDTTVVLRGFEFPW
jgi:4-diphosphocytidyl-2-C-methyl-D-erythritol kinase